MLTDENSISKRNLNLRDIKNSWSTECINCLNSKVKLPIISLIGYDMVYK